MRVIFTAVAFCLALFIMGALALLDWIFRLNADTWALALGACAICFGLSLWSDSWKGPRA